MNAYWMGGYNNPFGGGYGYGGGMYGQIPESPQELMQHHVYRNQMERMGAQRGSIIGGSAGAALGGMISNDPAGSMVGGILGVVIGNEMGRERGAQHAVRSDGFDDARLNGSPMFGGYGMSPYGGGFGGYGGYGMSPFGGGCGGGFGGYGW